MSEEMLRGEKMNIQWFPGHMTKARRMMAEDIKMCDAVCEIIDARIPVSSRNPDMDELTAGKPRLIIMNRVDQADPAETKKVGFVLCKTGSTRRRDGLQERKRRKCVYTGSKGSA